jgi:phosphatidylserine decarboxylase
VVRPPGPGWRATLALLARLPQGALSRGFGRLADAPLPRALRRPVLGAFARAVGIDVAEAELPLVEYPTLNAFFVRRLRPGVRDWPSDPRAAGSPVDGVVGAFGRVRSGTLLQAKGRPYAAADLLGDAGEAAAFDGGHFLTIYLSPRHYHRIHAPCDGGIIRARHVPGALLPVNEPAIAAVDGLFPRNERLVVQLDGALGRVAVVAIGAYNVGRISAAFAPDWGAPETKGWVTNRSRRTPETRTWQPALAWRRGDELMAFHLGSTVVLLFEAAGARLAGRLREGAEVRLGTIIAEPASP